MSESAPDVFASVPPPLAEALRRRGFEALTAVQEAVVAVDTSGHDLRISSQTGSGKTVALGLAIAPSLLSDGAKDGPKALVLAPTRELASQVASELADLYEALPIDVQVVTGGTDPHQERRRLKRAPTILVATPGRLLDHARGRAVDLSHVRHAVLDEADQMLDLGFRDELDAILEQLPEERRLHMVSATFARQVLRFADGCQKNVLHLQGSRLGAANTDIEHIAHLVAAGDRHPALVNLLLADEASGGGSWLVFVRTRNDATRLAELLVEDGFSAMPFSGELSQPQRERTLNGFKAGLVKVLVATDVAARGIDVQNVSQVVHFELPRDVDTFTHRSGRTGRAGQKGRSLLLVPPSGERRVRGLADQAGVELAWHAVPDAKRIEKAAIKKTRRMLQARLSREDQPASTKLDYAAKLLSENAPETLVAILLDMVKPALPCEPWPIRPIEPRGPQVRDGKGPRAGRPRARSKPRSKGRFKTKRRAAPRRS